MNCKIVIKKTSFGISDHSRRAAVRAKGYTSLKCSDPKKHVPYVDRYGTLTDEMGVSIPKAHRMKELDARLAMSVNPDRDIYCLSASLPHHRTAEAMDIILDYCRENFGTFLAAFHHKWNHKKERQEHIHIDVFNDQKNHPLNRLVFLQQMKEEIGARFAAAGISFPDHIPRPRFEPTGDALNAERRREIEAEMKVAFQRSLYMSRSIEDWTDALSGAGLSVSRTTKAGLVTLENAEGYRMRLERISEGKMTTRDDVIGYLSTNNQQQPGQPGQKEVKEEVKMEEEKQDFAWEMAQREQQEWSALMSREQTFAQDYARRAAALTIAGLTVTQISKKLDTGYAGYVPATIKEAGLLTRQNILNNRREKLEKALSKNKLADIEKSAKSRGIDLSKALNAVKQSGKVMSAAASGDAMPMLMMLANIITPMVQAVQDKAQREAPGRKIREIREEAKQLFEGNKLAERAAMDIYRNKEKDPEKVWQALAGGAYSDTSFSFIYKIAKDEKGIDLQKIVSGTDMSLKIQAASGEPLPLINYLIKAIWGDARDISISKKFTLPEIGKGLSIEQGRALVRKAAASIKPGVDDVSTIVKKGPGE